jgi:hypothetical protein
MKDMYMLSAGADGKQINAEVALKIARETNKVFDDHFAGGNLPAKEAPKEPVVVEKAKALPPAPIEVVMPAPALKTPEPAPIPPEVVVNMKELKAPTQWNIADKVLTEAYGTAYKELNQADKNTLLSALTREMMQSEHRDIVEGALTFKNETKAQAYLDKYAQKHDGAQMMIKDPTTHQERPATTKDLAPWLKEDAKLAVKTDRFDDMLDHIAKGTGKAKDLASKVSEGRETTEFAGVAKYDTRPVTGVAGIKPQKGNKPNEEKAAEVTPEKIERILRGGPKQSEIEGILKGEKRKKGGKG